MLCHTTRLSAAARTEVAAAQKQGLEVLDRPHLLARVLRQADAIGVAGTHGKTTTTAMLAHLLEVVGEQPSALIGDGASSRIGASCVIVAELDESDRSLPLHHPGTAVVTGVEFDHSDYFTDLDDVRGMLETLEGLPRDGLAVLCADDPWLGRQPVAARRRTYGYAANADYRVDEEGVVRRRGETLARLRLRAPGRMTRQDAAAALAVAVERGIDPERAAEALATFPGARRRLERLGGGTVRSCSRLRPPAGPGDRDRSGPAQGAAARARPARLPAPPLLRGSGDIEDALMGPLRSADRASS